MRDDAAPGPLTQAYAPQAPGRLDREDARTFGGGTQTPEFYLYRSATAFQLIVLNQAVT